MDTLGIQYGEKDTEYVAKAFCQEAEGISLHNILYRFSVSHNPVIYVSKNYLAIMKDWQKAYKLRFMIHFFHTFVKKSTY